MIAGYRCNYCSTFLTDAAKMSKHEQSCIFNPDNQLCFSCRHKIETFVLFGDFESCANDLAWEAVENNETPCPGWAAKNEQLTKVM